MWTGLIEKRLLLVKARAHLSGLDRKNDAQAKWLRG
jgi:hypothetical protein